MATKPFQGLLADAINSPTFNLGVGLLAASGPSTTPVSFGQALGQGMRFAQRAQLAGLRTAEARERLLKLAQERRASSAVQELLAQQGGSPALRQLAAIDPVAALKALAPQPTNLEREFQFLTSIGVPRDRAIEALQKGTTINMADSKLDQPIPIAQVTNVRLPTGQSVPIGTTYRQAKEAGAQVLSTEEQKTVAQSDSALAVLDELERLAVGPEGIFQNVEPGVLNRGAAAIQFALADLTQTDPNVSRFRDLSSGTVSSFVRLLGERGSLSGPDVERAQSLLPKAGNLPLGELPDTREVARQKLRDLREIIERGVRNFNRAQSGAAPATDTQAAVAQERTGQGGGGLLAAGSELVERLPNMSLPQLEAINPANLSGPELQAFIARARSGAGAVAAETRRRAAQLADQAERLARGGASRRFVYDPTTGQLRAAQ